ncbi:MAG: hypothetical protein GEU95_26865 [Rhizobiales bacterium]|nr:hypothetical protein [Hyphomicrobiales bacterium]
MASAGLRSIRRTVTVNWPARHEREGRALLIRRAAEGHARIMREQTSRAGFAPNYEAYANSPGRPVASVKLPGPIVYRYFYYREIVAVALKALRDASPVGAKSKGVRYRDMHTVYVNGVAMKSLPPSVTAKDTIFIANPLQYSRRLEIGKTESGRDFLISVPNRIYERVTKNLLAPKYRNVARISFSYITPPDAYKLKHNQAARNWIANQSRWYVSPKQRSDRAKGAVVRSPAIIIEPLS